MSWPPAALWLVLGLSLGCGDRSAIDEGDSTGTEDEGDGTDTGQPDLPVEEQDLFFHCPEDTGGGSLPKMWICDGWPDCPWEDDEKPETCDEPEQFRCDDGTEVPWPEVCDGDEPRCPDGTDGPSFCNSFYEWYWPCDEYYGGVQEGARIPLGWVCDGGGDCPGQVDEDNDLCQSISFDCPDGLSLGPQRVCDGIPQCENGEDEPEEWCPRFVKGPPKHWYP